MLTWVAIEDKKQLLDAVHDWHRSLPIQGVITFHWMPTEGASSGGFVPFVDVPEYALEVLRLQGVPFTQSYSVPAEKTKKRE